MKDIKITKINKVEAVKPNKIAEIPAPILIKINKETSIYSAILFCFMSLSILCYVFMISSSIFYAVQASQLTLNTQNISDTQNTEFSLEEAVTKNVEGRVSYINKNSDTSISLK